MADEKAEALDRGPRSLGDAATELLRERLTNPLSRNIAISAALYNFDILLAVFSGDESVTQRLDLIRGWLTNDASTYRFTWPLLIGVAYTVTSPYIACVVYLVTRKGILWHKLSKFATADQIAEARRDAAMKGVEADTAQRAALTDDDLATVRELARSIKVPENVAESLYRKGTTNAREVADLPDQDTKDLMEDDDLLAGLDQIKRRARIRLGIPQDMRFSEYVKDLISRGQTLLDRLDVNSLETWSVEVTNFIRHVWGNERVDSLLECPPTLSGLPSSADIDNLTAQGWQHAQGAAGRLLWLRQEFSLPLRADRDS